jgi:iron complex outermembrane recepter protein
MRHLFLSASLGVLGAACTLALAAPASAEESTPSASETEVAQADASNAAAQEPAPKRKISNQIEEITVTARKREENLQETPIAITAFSADDLKDNEIRRINDIQSAVPNLQFDQAVGQSNAARIYIRGVGNGDPIGFDDPGVGLYVDGVYLPRAQGALLGISDIERVEVLRGPQGTLFGKNTIGGAVNIITQKASADEFKGEAEVRAGNYDLFETKVVMNVPIVPERFAGRFSFSTQQRDGYTKNRFLGGDATIGRRRQLAGRAQFMLAATDNLEFNLSADHSNEPNTPVPGHCSFVGPAPLGQGDAPPAVDTGATALAMAALAANVGDPAAFEKACRANDAEDEFKARLDGKLEDELKTWGTNLTATWSPSEAITFKSISSWRRNETHRSADADLTMFAITQDGRSDNDHAKQDSYSQEFNLSGVGLDNKLNWVLGLYGFSETNQDTERGQALPITNNRPALLGGAATTTITTNGIKCFATLNADGTTNPCGRRDFIGPRTEGFLKSDTTSYAAYTQATYDITEAFSMTGGIRFTHERKRIHRFTRITDPLDSGRLTAATITGPDRIAGTQDDGATADVEKSSRFDKWTPMLNLQYRFTDEINGYVTYSRGFKSGLLNGRATEIGGSLEVEPEVLTSYETGVKSQFLDNRLVLNVAAFTNVYRDIQLTVIAPNEMGNLVARIDNAGKAKINGAELEMVALPLAGLELNFGGGITAARYVEFDRPGFGNKKLPGTPTYTFNMGAAYTMQAGSLGDLRTRIGWSHVGEKGSDVADPHFNRSPKHGTLSSRISLQMADGVTEIAIFGDNLLDRTYIANAVRGITSSLQYYGAPRTYGIEVSRKF